MELAGLLASVVAIQAVVIGALMIGRARRAPEEREQLIREASLMRLWDRAPVVLWTARPDATLDYLNQTCADFTGRPLEQLVNEGWLDTVHPDDVAPSRDVYMPAVEARRPFQMEYRIKGADGQYHWMLAQGVPRYDSQGAYAGYVGCDLDITSRKLAEESMRESQVALEASHRLVQELAGRLIEAQDAERARIARDLHDDVSQQLAGISIAFSGVKQKLSSAKVDGKIQEEVQGLHQQATALAQSVRHLSHDLHPTVLRHAGLVAALTAYCHEVQRTHGLVVSCRASGEFSSLDRGASLCLYRAGQEALRNVVAHAAAERVDLALVREGDAVELTVADDGKGFEPGAMDRRKGLGLVSINERARLAGGTATVMSSPGSGTQVLIRIPALAEAATHRQAAVTRG